MSDSAAPSFLPVRLKRETEFKSQLGCTIVIALVLLGFATFAYFAGRSPGEHSWVAYVVSGGFGFFGLLCLWSFIRQLFASGIPVTVVEVSEQPLQPGQSAKVCVVQAGPANLKSLRANLLCIERRTTWARSSNTTGRRRQVNDVLLSTENLVDAQHLRVAAGDTWHELREFTLPADARVSSVSGDIEILWKIEVWGAGYGLASFMHPFIVDVFCGQRPPEDEEDEQEQENDVA